MGRFKDLTGLKFNHLLVNSINLKDSNGNLKWNCTCDCGNTIVVYGDNLRRNHTKSCGCKKGQIISAKKIKHGCSKSKEITAEYRTWSNILSRCYNKKASAYERYGGVGISVCKRWRDSFENFLLDMGERPSKFHSIDRYPDKNGNYCPENCRWATLKEQAQNKNNNVWYEKDGIKMIQSDWSKKLNVTDNAIKFHMKSGKTFSETHDILMR